MPQFHFTAKVFYRPNLHHPGDRFELAAADIQNLTLGGSGHAAGGCADCAEPDVKPELVPEPPRPDAPADGPISEGPAVCETCGKKFPGGAAALSAHRLQKHK
jgi:hypothetical protein